jgi:hypothetical protein
LFALVQGQKWKTRGGEKEFGGWEEKNSLTDELLRLPDYC